MTNDPVIAGACLGWRPPTRLPVWKWASENVKIQNSERSSKYDPEQTPWVKGPMEAFGDIETRQIVCPWPTGAGKSTMAEACIPYVIAENPGPLMYLSQTDPDAKYWWETRGEPAAKSVSSVRDLWPVDRHKSRKLECIFPHMPVVLGGANISNTQEKSMRYLWGDECIFWGAGILRDFQARHHNRWNRKVVLVSQGGAGGNVEENGSCTGGDEFWQEWMRSDRGEFSWKCDCGEAQAYAFESLKYDTIEGEGGKIDDQATAETARMVCRSCSAEYRDNARTRRRLASSNMDNGSFGYIATNPNPMDFQRGFHVDGLAVWNVSWGENVMEFLQATRLAKSGVIDNLKKWHQKRRARFWTDDMTDSTITVTESGFSKADHADGELIEGETHRFATTDVGGDHYWTVIGAWRQGGTMRVIWEGYTLSDGDQELALRDQIVKYNVKPSMHFIDIGYEQDRVLDLCVKHGWTGVKGEGNKRFFLHRGPNGKPIEKLYSEIKKIRAKSGGIAKYMWLCSNQVKDILQRIIASGDQVEFPSDLSVAFRNHMKCERRIVEINKKSSEEISVWIRPGNRPNHQWDSMYYQVGAALAMRVFDEA